MSGNLDPQHVVASVPYRVARGQLRLVSTLPASERAELVRRLPVLAAKPQLRLARDVDLYVRRRLVDHRWLLPETQLALLETTGRDAEMVRSDLSRSKCLAPETARRILELEPNARSALQGLAVNPLTPPDVLVDLMEVRHEDVAATARLHPNNPRGLEPWGDPPFMLNYEQQMENRHADPRVLAEAAASANAGWQGSAAGNPSTPVRALEAIATSRLSSAHLELARNPAISPLCVEALLLRHEDVLRMRLAANPATPPEALLRLDEENGASTRVQSALAVNPNTPRELLLRYLEEGLASLQRKVTENPIYDLELFCATPVKVIHPFILAAWCISSPDWETIRALSLNWEGTAGSLLEACEILA